MPPRPLRRALVRMGLSLALVAASGLDLPLRARADDARPSLFVFLQLDVKSNALEQALQKELPGLAVTVFGRLRDFQDSIASKNPDAIIAIAPLLEQAQAKPSLLGMRGGKEWEPYLLLMTAAAAAAAGTNKPSLAGKTVGIVDLLGRDGTQAFAAAAAGTPDVKVKRVAKIEDLLPLLEFSAADAVLIPSSAVKRFTERTRLAMAVRELPNARVGLPAVAVRNEKARAVIIQAIQQLEGETRSLLGIDSWSPR